jgi:threonine dehydrogenase-like Zn-dependent dehydrogenase
MLSLASAFTNDRHRKAGGNMQALYWNGSGSLEWHEEPEPAITAPTDALVRPIAVSTCDLDQAIIHAEEPIPGSEQPYAIGHEGVGEVLEVGPGVTGLRPGDVVAIAYHISCGTCDRCLEHRPLFCRTSYDGAIATYGVPIGKDYGGLFSDLVRVPFADQTLVRLPPSVSALEAVSVGDNLTDAWRTVAPYLGERPGCDVLILGGSSIGLYAADIARALGAREVLYVDADRSRRELAERLGAHAQPPADFDPYRHANTITVNAAADASGGTLRSCLLATEPDGICVNTSLHFADPEMPLLHMFLNCLTLTGGLSHARPNMPAVLSLITSGRITPGLVATDVLDFETAAQMMAGAGFKPVFIRDPIMAPPERLRGAGGDYGPCQAALQPCWTLEDAA